MKIYIWRIKDPSFSSKNPLNECVETIFFEVEQMRNPNKPPPPKQNPKRFRILWIASSWNPVIFHPICMNSLDSTRMNGLEVIIQTHEMDDFHHFSSRTLNPKSSESFGRIRIVSQNPFDIASDPHFNNEHLPFLPNTSLWFIITHYWLNRTTK